MAAKLQGEAVISALIGLAGACNNNSKTPQTDRVLLRALAGELDADAVRAEKFAVAPDCAVCISPCGNTSDYDMSRLYTADAEVCERKLQIIEAMREAASCLLHASEPETELFYKALLYVGSDLDIDLLQALLEEVQAFQRKIKEDQAL